MQASSGVFSYEPQDVCTLEGQDVFFPCEYNSTSDYSVLWRINGRIRSAARPPPLHMKNATGLVVIADVSNDLFTYSCIIRTSESVECESKTAVLTVIEQVASSGEQLRHVYYNYAIYTIIIACPLLKPTPSSVGLMSSLFTTSSHSVTPSLSVSPLLLISPSAARPTLNNGILIIIHAYS